MFEKVNPNHPDKVADRIAGAIVDLAYSRNNNPKVAVEVLIGHNKCLVINETDTEIDFYEIEDIVFRITKDDYIMVDYIEVPQNSHLANNQKYKIRCGDNGIFKGTPRTTEQETLTQLAEDIYSKYPTDGKYLINNGKITVCQSCCKEKLDVDVFNPLGYWIGGTDVDSGATNRKLGSDMGDGVTGGGLHGKDLSKADVSVNIMCYLLAQKNNCVVTACCNIGDTEINFNIKGNITTIPYENVVATAYDYIKDLGGFEKFAEWGLIR